MRHTHRSVVERTRREFAELDRLVTRLSPADWGRRVPRPSTRDPWTVKDALAHILYWKEHTARVIRGERRLPEMRGLDVEGINRLIYERWRRRRPAELVAWHRRVHQDVLRTLQQTPDAWFGQRERSAQWPLDFDGHSAAHRVKDIESVLGGPASDGAVPPKARRPMRRTTDRR
ncbi:MAG TPA: maleylpyruvate isomerase N-terminal domain-containing protein [Candidatus Methylomirabilis sp.]|nr:maleylpyruvate isomerase N-terminal domain-containing protein [Candidatus Methylomirabilis sp.]